jgi:DNA-binding XRE family transcriptional regulator
MTPARYKSARKLLGTQASVAKLLGVSRVSVARRETGKRPVSREAWLALRALGKKSGQVSDGLPSVRCFSKAKPKNGQCVIWIWAHTGLVATGDYYNRQVRDAAKDYEPIADLMPTHWVPWPHEWPEP